MSTWRILFVTITAVVQAACGSAIFRDTFEADVAGSPPQESPPGDPENDLVYLSSPTSGSAVVVEAPGAGGRSEKKLEYRNVNVAEALRFLGFIGREINASTVQVWATWSGNPNLRNEASPLDIWIGDSHFRAIAGIRLDNGEVFRQTSADGDYVRIGTYVPGEPHTMVIKVDRTSGTYVIAGFARTGFTTGVQPVLDRAAATTTRPSVYFWYSGPESSGGSNYSIEQITITEACPTEAGRVGGCN